MTSLRIGENISREWDEEHCAPELWDALRQIKAEPHSGLLMLEALANDGSPLAMTYLGSIYMTGEHGLLKDHQLGERWLRRSAEAGSIEGRFGLAHYLSERQQRSDALVEYQRLAEMGYSPAIFVLGSSYWSGSIVGKDAQRAVRYFEDAARRGHIYAAVMNCYIEIRYGDGLWCRFRAIVNWSRMLGVGWTLKLRYPSSDRLRRY
jgi:TPR repeat protein